MTSRIMMLSRGAGLVDRISLICVGLTCGAFCGDTYQAFSGKPPASAFNSRAWSEVAQAAEGVPSGTDARRLWARLPADAVPGDEFRGSGWDDFRGRFMEIAPCVLTGGSMAWLLGTATFVSPLAAGGLILGLVYCL